MGFNVEFINPFLEAVMNVLKTMAATDAKPGKPFVKEGERSKGDVSGVIGMVGDDANGSFAISFTQECVLAIVGRMLMDEFTEVDDEIIDAVGEITNMVSGGAKRTLSEKGYRFNMATPTMVSGRGHEIKHIVRGPIIILPFSTDVGDFFVEVAFQI